jgi:hypothetical protein
MGFRVCRGEHAFALKKALANRVSHFGGCLGKAQGLLPANGVLGAGSNNE